MLLNLREYHRPAEAAPGRAFDHALDLLARPDIHTVPLAGGDTLFAAADPSIEAVVDLRGLGLDTIRWAVGAGTCHIGAMVTRTALAEELPLGALYCGILTEAARHWAGSVQRNRATVGGAVVIAAADDPLVAALLACDALVTVLGRTGATTMPLADFLARRADLLKMPALVTELICPRPVPFSGAALAWVARTPSDAPIVVAAATVRMDGARCSAARLALGGVAGAPLDLSGIAASLVGQTPSEEVIAALATCVEASVAPAADFRGSSTYRRAMAGALSGRALRQAWQRAA
jgi:carbon-monoxide dehydrogenase medium subunit